jgi:F-type H+-transporting ATPase subunit b
MLDLNPGLILWTIITFLAAMLILRRFAWKPLLGALAAREEKIRAQLERAEHAQAEAERLLSEHQRQLLAAEEQSQRIIREGRTLAEQMKSDILEKASSSARVLIEQAKGEIQREKESALEDLRAEVADLAIMAAGKILDANLDTPKQRQLVDAVIRDINRDTNA